MHLYPDNKPYSFKVQMKESLYLQDVRKIALTDVSIKENSSLSYINHLRVFCDIAGKSIIYGEKRPFLLRK